MAPDKKKDTHAPLVPKLRFPEFVGAGEWEEKRLRDVSPVIFDGTHQTPTYTKEGVPFYSVENLVSGNKNKYISQCDYIAATAKNKPEKGDILITRIGKIGYSKVISWGHEFSIYVTLAVIKKSNYFDSNYLNLFIQSNWYQTEILQKSLLNAVPCKINMDSLRITRVLLPKLPEQQRIADCLTSLDENITAESHKLEALTAHKKALMQKLFPADGDKVPVLRFKEFAGAGEWEEKQLADVADKKIKWSFVGGPFGSNLKHSDYTEKGVRIIQLQNIGDADFIDTYKIYTSTQKADELLSCNICPGDIILSKMGDPVGRACIIPTQDKRYLMCSDGIRLVVNEQKYNKKFIYLALNSNTFRKLLEKTATGSTRKRIGLDELRKLPQYIPHLSEQQRIADCLASLDEYITAQGRKIALLKEHKKGLMQQLFPRMEEENV